MSGQNHKTTEPKKQSRKAKAAEVNLFTATSDLVTVLIPIHRLRDYENVRSNVSRQTYKNCEFVVVANEGFPAIDFGDKTVRWMEVSNEMNIGDKRNYGLSMSKGTIIVHMDADDIYASDWVERSVAFMEKNPNCLVTGLSECIFQDIVSGTKYLYSYNGRQGYVVGATMCYRRDLWAALKFNSMKESEDTDFVKRVGIMIFPHGYNEGFTAILHGENTASHKAIPYMKIVP